MKHHEIDQLMDDYFNGLYFGDLTRLKTIFHPSAVYAYSVGEESCVLDMLSYFERVKQRVPPCQRGESQWFQIDTLDWISETFVVIKAQVRMLGRHYYDVLSLMYIEGRWVIVAKMFHYKSENG
jgi:Putative lumazine-binding